LRKGGGAVNLNRRSGIIEVARVFQIIEGFSIAIPDDAIKPFTLKD
jgi:hypothetical protein